MPCSRQRPCMPRISRLRSSPLRRGESALLLSRVSFCCISFLKFKVKIVLKTLVNETIIFQFFCCVNKKSMLKKTAVTLELASIFSSFAFRSFFDIFCAFHFFVFYKSHKKSAKIFTLYFAKEWHILTNFGADFAHFLTNLLLKATKKRQSFSAQAQVCTYSVAATAPPVGNVRRYRRRSERHSLPLSGIK